ncbi:unnamed protein product [Peniophora sp. CBMAI 1063]|nr:unnamed protein product [Peniophora sp. CBMAI 1063]
MPPGITPDKSKGPSTTSLTSKLPPELLLIISEHLTSRQLEVYAERRSTTSLDDPRALSQVCSRWRTTALNSKILWTSIPLVNEFWASISLERSRPLPVSVSISLDYSPWSRTDEDAVRAPFELYHLHDGIMKALSESHRIHILDIDASVFDDDRITWLTHKIFTFLGSTPMPQLESVYVNLQWHELYGEYASFLDRHTPRNLRHLSLLRGIDQRSLPCPHLFAAPLTVLKLECGAVWETMDDALNALSALPTLEVLAIDRDKNLDESWDQAGALPEFDISELINDARRVSLPNLRELILCEPLAHIAYLLKCLVFPPTARIELNALHQPEEENAIRDLIEGIVASLAAHYAPLISEGYYFDSLLLDVSLEYGRRRLVVGADRAQRFPTTTQTPAKLIPISSKGARTLRVRPHMLPFSLSLSDDNSFTSRELVKLFVDRLARLPSRKKLWNTMLSSLEQVSVAHFYGHTGIQAILGLLREDEGVTHRDLVDLTFEELSFVPPSELASERKPACVPFDALVSVLHRRTGPDRIQSVANLRQLEFKNCDIECTQIDVLRHDFGEGFVSWERQRGTDESSRQAQRDRMRSVTVEEMLEAIAHLKRERQRDRRV